MLEDDRSWGISDGRLIRVTQDRLYLVDAGASSEHAAIALDGISLELADWLATIDSSQEISQLIWDAESHGLDPVVAGTVLRRLSELGALGEPKSPRQNRPIRVGIVGDVPRDLVIGLTQWDLETFAPWSVGETTWDQVSSWDRLSELVQDLLDWRVDLVIQLRSSTLFDAFDLAFHRQLRLLGVPHLPIGLTSTRALLGPLVDFRVDSREVDNHTFEHNGIPAQAAAPAVDSQVLGFCTDCVAEMQQEADPAWASLTSQLALVRRPPVTSQMLLLALVETSRWVSAWWQQDPAVARLRCSQLGTRLRELAWHPFYLGVSGACRHPVRTL